MGDWATDQDRPAAASTVVPSWAVRAQLTNPAPETTTQWPVRESLSFAAAVVATADIQ